MPDGIVEIGLGLLIGGLSMSACWGLFWLSISAVGVSRGTCSWRALLNSLAVSAVPLLLVVMLMWLRGFSHPATALFTVGLSIMPVVLVLFGLRQTPDGRRAGVHMLNGVRGLKEELLGAHRGCGGCSQEHDHEGCG